MNIKNIPVRTARELSLQTIKYKLKNASKSLYQGHKETFLKLIFPFQLMIYVRKARELSLLKNK